MQKDIEWCSIRNGKPDQRKTRIPGIKKENHITTEYHKIQTLWLRNPETKYKTLLEGQWSLPEFEYLANCPWEWTEKIDGTNIRVIVQDGLVTFGGKTERAQIPAKLMERLIERFYGNPVLARHTNCVLYGEGYGSGIQVGGDYRPDQDFILFDVWVGHWLDRKSIEGIGHQLGVDVAPIVGTGTLGEAVEWTRNSPSSTIGTAKAEGLVMRPLTELRTQGGDRVITKIKSKDIP